MQQLKSATVAILKRCQFGTFELLHGFSNFLWLNNFFLGHYEKVSIQSCPKSVSDSVKIKIWPHPEGKSQFSWEAIDRIQFFQLF